MWAQLWMRALESLSYPLQLFSKVNPPSLVVSFKKKLKDIPLQILQSSALQNHRPWDWIWRWSRPSRTAVPWRSCLTIRARPPRQMRWRREWRNSSRRESLCWDSSLVSNRTVQVESVEQSRVKFLPGQREPSLLLLLKGCAEIKKSLLCWETKQFWFPRTRLL